MPCHGVYNIMVWIKRRKGNAFGAAGDRQTNHQDHEKGFVFFLQCHVWSLPKLWIFDNPPINNSLTINEYLVFTQKGNKHLTITLASVYHPCTKTGWEDIDARSLNTLDTLLSKLPADNEIVMGADVNASIGTLDKLQSSEFQSTLGPHGFSKRNSKGEGLLTVYLAHRLHVMNTFYESRANGPGYGMWTSNRPTSTGLSESHMLDLIVCSTTLHKRVKNCQVTNNGADSDHRAVRMQLNLPSKKKCPLIAGKLTGGRYAKKTNNTNSTTNTSLNLPLAPWPITLFVKPWYVLAVKQPSPLSANAKDGTKQANLFSFQPSKKKPITTPTTRKKHPHRQQNCPPPFKAQEHQQTQPGSCRPCQSMLV